MTREEVYKTALEYFKGNELAANVWTNKYCLRDKENYLESTPDDMHKRLAKELARIEAKYENPLSENQIYNLLVDFKYLVPQGSPMAGIGNPFAISSISNCFVIGNHNDSYGGIMLADQQQVQLMKRRGGVGQDLSYIRPSGAMAGNSPLGENAGMTLYMDRYSNSTQEVQQDGRRGALMLSVDIKHPDAEKFIDKKMTKGVAGANVSVRISDEFMKSVHLESDFVQTFPIDLDLSDYPNIESIIDSTLVEDELFPLELKNGDFKGCYIKLVSAKRIFDKIVHNAWASAEPGILFWDKILSEATTAGYGKEWKPVSTNPCGEIPLNPFDSCRLLAINLSSYVSQPFTENAALEIELLKEHSAKAQRLMDDIVDLEIEKIDKIIEHIKNGSENEVFKTVELDLWYKILDTAKRGRRTGLGVLGEADLMAKLGIKYGSKAGTIFSEKIHQTVATSAFKSSIEMAKERGAFPDLDLNKEIGSDFTFNSAFLERMIEDSQFTLRDLDDFYEYGRRNIALLTIAPTGSTSLLTETTSGIEPLFSPYYFRKKKAQQHEKVDFTDEYGDSWVEFAVFHKPFVEWYFINSETPFHTVENAELFLRDMKKKELDEIFKLSPYFEATAQDVDYIEKVRMQGAVQKWVDHSISVTVNMPEHVTEDIVADVYKTAHESGCKGITVYRENSRGNVLATESVKDKGVAFDYLDAVERPKVLPCDIFRGTARKEEFIAFVGKIDNKPYEIFAIPSLKANVKDSLESGFIEKVSKNHYRVIDEDKNTIVDNLTGLMIETEQNETRSLSALLRHRVEPIYIADMIAKYATISSFQKIIEKAIRSYSSDSGSNSCPECGGKITMTEGCEKCVDCGFAKCG